MYIEISDLPFNGTIPQREREREIDSERKNFSIIGLWLNALGMGQYGGDIWGRERERLCDFYCAMC